MPTSTIDAHDHSPPSILARRPILTAIAIGAGSLLPHAFLPRQASLAFAAVLIALIAGIYFGFAVVNRRDRRSGSARRLAQRRDPLSRAARRDH